jgi:hypothetical protein
MQKFLHFTFFKNVKKKKNRSTTLVFLFLGSEEKSASVVDKNSHMSHTRTTMSDNTRKLLKTRIWFMKILIAWQRFSKPIIGDN